MWYQMPTFQNLSICVAFPDSRHRGVFFAVKVRVVPSRVGNSSRTGKAIVPTAVDSTGKMPLLRRALSCSRGQNELKVIPPAAYDGRRRRVAHKTRVAASKKIVAHRTFECTAPVGLLGLQKMSMRVRSVRAPRSFSAVSRKFSYKQCGVPETHHVRKGGGRGGTGVLWDGICNAAVLGDSSWQRDPRVGNKMKKLEGV